MTVVVFYYRRQRPTKLRVGTWTPPEGADLKQYRLDLIADLNRTNKRVKMIKVRP